MTAIQVINLPSPKLQDITGINLGTGEPEGFELMLAQIFGVVKFFGAGWDSMMVEESARIAYDAYGWMTIAELKYFFSRLKLGKYPSNQNFKPNIFMEHLNNFTAEVLSTRAKYTMKPEGLPVNPATGEPGKEIDDAKIRLTINKLIKRFKEITIEMAEQQKKERRERNHTLQRHRDQQIINLIEHDGSQGIAPDKHLMELYFTALKRMEEK